MKMNDIEIIFGIEVREGQAYVVDYFINNSKDDTDKCLCTASDLAKLSKGEPIRFISNKDSLSEIFDESHTIKEDHIHLGDIVGIREFHISEIFGEEE